MALRGNKVSKPQTETTDQETQETSTQETETMTETQPDVETKEVVVKEAQQVAVLPEGVMPSIASLADKWDPNEMGNMFSRIKASNGNLNSDGVSFGEYIDVQVYSHSPRWFVTPISEQGDTEAAKFCRASYDGTTILDRDSGDSMTIAEYTDGVEGYEFRTGKYQDLYCIIFGADKNADKAMDLNIVQVSVSPTSVKGFTSFMMQTKLSVLRGQMLATHQNCMRVSAVAQESKKGSYTSTAFGAVPIDVVSVYTPIPE